MTADLSGSQQSINSTEISKQAPQAFSATSLSIRAQKKVASKLSNRNFTKLLIPDSANRLLDHLLTILQANYNKKEAEKVIKNIIKLVVKMGLLSKNNLLNDEAERQLCLVEEQVHGLALTVISFGKVAYSYDRSFFFTQLRTVKDTLTPLVVLHLSDKSSKRLEHIFEHLLDNHMADTLFRVNGPQSRILESVVTELEQLVEAKDL